VSHVHQLERRGEPGEPTADDGDFHSRFATTIRSFVAVERRGLPSKNI